MIIRQHNFTNDWYNDEIYIEELASIRGELVGQLKNTTVKNYQFIITPSHGFLVVPSTDKYYQLAKKIQSDGFGYKGKSAIYLEEDCQASEFIHTINGNYKA